MRKPALTAPSVGAIVHYFTRDPDEQLWGNRGGPYAAIVTGRREDTLLALAIVPPFSGRLRAVGWVRHRAAADAADVRCWDFEPAALRRGAGDAPQSRTCAPAEGRPRQSESGGEGGSLFADLEQLADLEPETARAGRRPRSRSPRRAFQERLPI